MASRGRPREFDRDDAVEKAMLLFWEYGYESTSLSKLRSRLGGLSAASFYAAFGSKDKLFTEVIDRYLESYGRVTDSLLDNAIPCRDAVENALRESVRMQTDSTHPSGCLLVFSSNTCPPDHEQVVTMLASRRHERRTAFTACVHRAFKRGELQAEADPDGLAALLCGFLFGLTTQTRDRIPAEVLSRSIDVVMGIWDDNSRKLVP